MPPGAQAPCRRERCECHTTTAISRRRGVNFLPGCRISGLILSRPEPQRSQRQHITAVPRQRGEHPAKQRERDPPLVPSKVVEEAIEKLPDREACQADCDRPDDRTDRVADREPDWRHSGRTTRGGNRDAKAIREPREEHEPCAVALDAIQDRQDPAIRAQRRDALSCVPRASQKYTWLMVTVAAAATTITRSSFR